MNMNIIEKQMREFNKRIKEGYVVDWDETRQEGGKTIIAFKRSISNYNIKQNEKRN